ncbi:MAG: hypothetical protein EBZ77_14335, partial [Chitinophagia bacterium]|nr:hypothetical protein [Chitinophagia bacterium]
MRAPKNMWTHLYDTLRDIFESPTGTTDDDVLLLVDYKNGNTALRKLLNTISRRGLMRIHIHGVDDLRNDDDDDGDDDDHHPKHITSSTTTPPPPKHHPHCRKPTLTCGTFWSAKGLECRTCIVLLPEKAARNPTYVALTRASHRLVVVLDPRRPHPDVCAALHSLSTSRSGSGSTTRLNADAPEYVRYADEFCRHVVRTGAIAHADGGADGLCKRDWTTCASLPTTDDDGYHTRNMDRWTPRSNVAASSMMVVATTKPPPSSSSSSSSIGENDDTADDDHDPNHNFPPLHPPHHKTHRPNHGCGKCTNDVVVHMCLVAAECVSKCRVRAVEDIVHPTRLDRDRHATAIRAGCASRLVSPFATDDELLADDLRDACVRAYDRMITTIKMRRRRRTSVDDHDHDMRASTQTHEHERGHKRQRATSDCKEDIDDVTKCVVDVAIVALSIVSFDAWDHTMRTLLPSVRTWSPNALFHMEFVMSVVPRTSHFDVRLCAESCHVRVHATTSDRC